MARRVPKSNRSKRAGALLANVEGSQFIELLSARPQLREAVEAWLDNDTRRTSNRVIAGIKSALRKAHRRSKAVPQVVKSPRAASPGTPSTTG